MRRYAFPFLFFFAATGLHLFWFLPAAETYGELVDRRSRACGLIEGRARERRAFETMRAYVSGDGEGRGTWIGVSHDEALAGILADVRGTGAELLFLHAGAPHGDGPFTRQAFLLGVRGDYAGVLAVLRALESGAPLFSVDLFHILVAPNSGRVTLRAQLTLITGPAESAMGR